MDPDGGQAPAVARVMYAPMELFIQSIGAHAAKATPALVAYRGFAAVLCGMSLHIGEALDA